MNEQLPDGLQLAVNIIREEEWPESTEKNPLDAVLNEHAQRLTLQHHACDQAQRIADLERHAANLVSESEAKIPAMQAAFEERLTLDRANRLLVTRIADLETKCDTLKRLHDAAADERDEWRRIASAYSPQKELSTALEQAKASGRQARKERDALRARLAEIEAQEPAMYVLRSAAKRPQPAVVKQKKYLSCAISDLVDMGLEHIDPLFTRPVPAQAVPDGCGACGDGCVKRGSCRLVDESPEHKA